MNGEERNYLELENQLVGFLKKQDKLSIAESDFLIDILNRIQEAQFFFRHAKTPNWLTWCDEQGYLDPIFSVAGDDEGGGLKEISNGFAGWFASTGLIEFPEESLDMVIKHDYTLHHLTWMYISSFTAYEAKNWNHELLAGWVNILIKNHRPDEYSDRIEPILMTCKREDDDETMLMLFEYLTTPRLVLRESYQLTSEDNGNKFHRINEVKINGKDYYIRKAWSDIIKPNISRFSERLIPIVTHHFEMAVTLLKAHEHGYSWDPISHARHAIEENPGNHGYHDMDMLVTVGRDSIEWLIENDIEYANAIITQWSKSSSIVLNRMAIHAMKLHHSYSADQKVKWLLDQDRLYELDYHYEVFKLLEIEYPKLGKEIREQLLKRIMKGPDIKNGSRNESYYFHICRILNWLIKADTDCSLVKTEMERIKDKCECFKDLKYDNPLVEMSEIIYGFRSSRSLDDLVSMNPSEVIKCILEFEPQSPLDEKEGLLRNFTAGVVKKPEWGIKCLEELIQEKQWDKEIWSGLIYGFFETELSDEQWKIIITGLKDNIDNIPSNHDIALLLSQGSTKKQGRLPDEIIEDCLIIADRIWTRTETGKVAGEFVDMDWMFAAVNHTAGKLTEFWMHALYVHLDKSETKKIPENYKIILSRILDGKTDGAIVSISVVMSRLYWIYYYDTEWVRENMLPLLDMTKIENKRVHPAWDGYLYSHVWQGQKMFDDVISIYDKAFPNFKGVLKDRMRARFCEFVAVIAVYGQFNSDRKRLNFINRFIQNAELQDRNNWALHVGRFFEKLEDKYKPEHWKGWIKPYWENRNAKNPELHPEEVDYMVTWMMHLEPVFLEVIELLLKSPHPNLKDQAIFYKLKELPIVDKYPEDTALMLDFLLEKFTGNFWDFKQVEDIVRKLNDKGVSKKVLRNILNSLVRLGSSNASNLAVELGLI